MADKLITFAKYHGLGNDFIITNAANSKRHMPTQVMQQLCQRRLGIGADGYVELQKSSISDFRLDYYNSDGNLSSLCGNAIRCAVAYAKKCGLFVGNSTRCEAIDGIHAATINPINSMITVEMHDVMSVKQYDSDNFFVDTGSPHHVRYVTNLPGYRVTSEGRALRWGLYGKEGSNINFVQTAKNGDLNIRTYERGVEDETLSCGTGITAAAIVTHFKDVQFDNNVVKGEEKPSQSVTTLVRAEGGEAVVSFNRIGTCTFTNMTLTGPVCHVYDGTLYC